MRGSSDWSEEQLQRAFAEGLQEASNVAKCWNERPWTDWTQLASAALGSAAGKAASDRGGIGDIQVAWKGHRDAHGRSEYLSLDVAVYDNDNWNSLFFAAEHENNYDPEKIEYCAWKLLLVDSEIRVLVAYFGVHGGYAGFDELVAGVDSVRKSHPDKALYVVAANANAHLEDGEMPDYSVRKLAN